MAAIVMVRVNFDLKEDGKKLPKGGGKRRGTKSDYCCVVGMWPSPKEIGLELCSILIEGMICSDDSVTGLHAILCSWIQ
ncbi:hypothetical protein TNCT_430051 [Trichonephila clavata]|uniref:Uncharacterized protein n=1 Tax=Trichonephila clavata TaxID=2740835 RepID=A0A8X6LDG3_TRICU|nr:hypothetical protein TNCT_430051 [Trichonephila clavata]